MEFNSIEVLKLLKRVLSLNDYSKALKRRNGTEKNT